MAPVTSSGPHITTTLVARTFTKQQGKIVNASSVRAEADTWPWSHVSRMHDAADNTKNGIVSPSAYQADPTPQTTTLLATSTTLTNGPVHLLQTLWNVKMDKTLPLVVPTPVLHPPQSIPGELLWYGLSIATYYCFIIVVLMVYKSM